MMLSAVRRRWCTHRVPQITAVAPGYNETPSRRRIFVHSTYTVPITLLKKYKTYFSWPYYNNIIIVSSCARRRRTYKRLRDPTDTYNTYAPTTRRYYNNTR